MNELTKAEEDVMHYLWNFKECLVRDIVDAMPEPKPAYNTVSTIVRILEKKEFVGHKENGKSYLYFPLVSKDEYTKFSIKNLIQGYFGGSYKKAVSFFVKEEKFSVQEMESLLEQFQGKDQLNVPE
ncbi:MAG: BlaI/MecI/CopY family transcriptional regulator [Bacteroidetes bacterium]|nr:BlaI/MecI/CopY family transcriptional regulator [Bacteroidota bacterium]